jgi:hypothetical protein
MKKTVLVVLPRAGEFHAEFRLSNSGKTTGERRKSAMTGKKRIARGMKAGRARGRKIDFRRDIARPKRKKTGRTKRPGQEGATEIYWTTTVSGTT